MGRSSANKRKAAKRERNLLIWELYAQGLSASEVIDEIVRRGFDRVHPSCVSRVVKELDLFPSSRRLKRVISVENWKKGCSIKENAERTKFNRNAVVNAIVSHIERESAETGAVLVSRRAKISGNVKAALEDKQIVYID